MWIYHIVSNVIKTELGHAFVVYIREDPFYVGIDPIGSKRVQINLAFACELVDP